MSSKDYMPLIILAGIAVAIYLFKDKIGDLFKDKIGGGGGGDYAGGGGGSTIIQPRATASGTDIIYNKRIIQSGVPIDQVGTRVNIANEYITALARTRTITNPSISKSPSIVKASLQTGMAVVGGKIVTPGQLLAGELLAVKALKGGK